jgi:hypothetical protein
LAEIGCNRCYRYLMRAVERRRRDLKNISGGTLGEAEDTYWLYLNLSREALAYPSEGRLAQEELMIPQEDEMVAERAQPPRLAV